MKIFTLSVVLKDSVNTPAHHEALKRELLAKSFTDHMVNPQGEKVLLPAGQFVIGVLSGNVTTQDIATEATRAAQIATRTENQATNLPFQIIATLVDGMPLVFSA